MWVVAFSPDGRRLASATGESGSLAEIGEMKIWDAITGKEILGLKGHASSVTSLAFSPDGKSLASSQRGSDRENLGHHDRPGKLHRRHGRHHGQQRGVQPGRQTLRLRERIWPRATRGK